MKIATNEQLFEAIEAITHRLDHIEQLAVIGSKTILDLTEEAIFTGYSESHLYNLTSRREIPHYKKNRKLYFKKQELEEWLLSEKVKTRQEIEQEATTYTVIRRKRY